MRYFYADALNDRGFRVVLAEYPGYGSRSGVISATNMINAGVQLIDTITSRWDDPIILWGESFGCAIASSLAAKQREDIAALVLLTPWNNLPDLAQDRIGRLIPGLWVRPLVSERYDNAKEITNFNKPILFVIADKDQIIPRQHSENLVTSYHGPQHVIHFINDGHNDWPIWSSHHWWDEASAYLKNLPRRTPRKPVRGEHNTLSIGK